MRTGLLALRADPLGHHDPLVHRDRLAPPHPQVESLSGDLVAVASEVLTAEASPEAFRVAVLEEASMVVEALVAEVFTAVEGAGNNLC